MPNLPRRSFLRSFALAAGTTAAARWFEPGVFAEEVERRTLTPELTEGPFYPDHLPLDTDNDLIVVNDSLTPAVGDITHLSGKILDSHGDPIRNATIEIWQVDHDGSYIHSHGTNHQSGTHDKNFQGYGRFLTGSTGEYYFRTIKPVPYPGRTPHIHVKVNLKNKNALTTQIFVKGEPQNRTDFTPMKNSKINELAATFDIVLGLTPEA
jgi:protocatechuate 3,4-dioxygenase beta subunit